MNRTDYGVLDHFHRLVAEWFVDKVGKPTELQIKAWPSIMQGSHVLITAPTGSGKTLAAFLCAVNQLITGERTLGQTSVLYVSPLKALNNDVQRNLLRPLAELQKIFEKAEEFFPDIGVATRSGDTPQSERRRMLRHPPEILITTPESLNLLLSSQGGRSILTGISTVILDEIHAVVGNKRGVHLITAVDRLVPMCGEFQRIALSATVRPLDSVAEFLGGYRMEGHPHSAHYSPRPVKIIESSQKKRYRIKVRFPEAAARWDERDSFWQPFVDEIKGIILKNRSTLIFTNSRRLCEKITHLVNQDEKNPIAYAHHGSLSREIRTEVERKLKAGELRAIVATNSLELGIDIGALDQVVLLQSPPSLSSAIQRIGRAGHRVGEVSDGALLPIDPEEIVQNAVLAAGVIEQEIEDVHPIQLPLDVLAQIIVSMVGVETWNVDDLCAWIKTSYPYRSISRRQFDLVLNMLDGRYAGSRLRELKPRIAVDRLSNTATIRKGALQDLYFSGGTIPDRGYFHLRHQESSARIGELDEEFVWEARVGQVFTLGTQNWKIERITHNDVFVSPAHPAATAPPFWRAEENLRGFYLSERIGCFLQMADKKLDDPHFKKHLQDVHCLDKTASSELINFLKRQKEETLCCLPHRYHVLVEHVDTGPGGYPGNQIVLHTLWGGRVNRPYAMALEAAWEERYGYRPQVYPSNDCLMLQLPHEVGAAEIFSLVSSSTAQSLLKKKLEGSGFFGARFRECAGRALLLTRRKMNDRMPLWLSRMRSQKLLESVFQYEDFPILLEAWRTCLQDEFELEEVVQVLNELESGAIQWSEVHTSHPSPMAQALTWPQINQYIYMDDELGSGRASRLRTDLLHEVVRSPELRPAVPLALAERFELKRQRLAPGYSPDNPIDLVEWIKERLLLPTSEWQRLLEAIESDHKMDRQELLRSVADRIVFIHPGRTETSTGKEDSLESVIMRPGEPLIVAVEELPRIIFGFYRNSDAICIERIDAAGAFSPETFEDTNLSEVDEDEVFASLLSQWLRYYAPRSIEFIGSTLGLNIERLEGAIESGVDSENLAAGHLVQELDEDAVCDSENYEILLRLMRAEARPAFRTLDLEKLQLFLASLQGITQPEEGREGLFQSLQQLVCFPIAAELIESELFPARMQSYDPSWLDSIMQQSDLLWIGTGKRRVCFCFEPDLDLLQEESRYPVGESPQERVEATPEDKINKGKGSELSELFRDPTARYDFSTLVRFSNQRPVELNQRLWKAVWRGEVTNDTFASLRHAIENNFKVTDLTERSSNRGSRRRRHSSRVAFSRWMGSLPLAGNWLCIAWPEHDDDLLNREERNKDRARLLLERYGILFREILQNELVPFSWPSVFRALRLMELSGEVLTGYFFHGIPGPQFISQQAYHRLQGGMDEDVIYWLSAIDPASLCGLRLEALKGKLPRRVAGTHLVYHGSRLVVESKRRGKSLIFHAAEDDPDLPNYLGPFHHMLTRTFEPMRSITIEKINGRDASESPYLELFRADFDVSVDIAKAVVYRKHF